MAGGLLMMSARCSDSVGWVTDAAELRSIAGEAYTFGYAMIENYRTLYEQAVDADDPRYTGGFGRYRHYPEPFTPDNTDIVTPNNRHTVLVGLVRSAG
jgi:hypothetical protein